MPPATRPAGADALTRPVAVLPVVALFRRVPQLSLVGPPPCVPLRSYAGPRACRLAVFVRLVFQCRVREAFVVAARPLRAALLALDLFRIDETVFLNPFRRPAVVFVVTYVLQNNAVSAPYIIDDGRRYLYVEVVAVAY